MLNLLYSEVMCLFDSHYQARMNKKSRSLIISLFVDWLTSNYDHLNDLKTDELRQIFYILVFDQVFDVLNKNEDGTRKKNGLSSKNQVKDITDMMIDPSNFGLDIIVSMLEDKKFFEVKMNEMRL